MKGTLAFCQSQFLSGPSLHGLARKWERTVSRIRVGIRACTETPDVGLVPAAGKTGTCCVNLWPIPILGGYNWFLNVYDRQMAVECGPFVVHHANDDDISISFENKQKPSTAEKSKTHTCFSGIATGNINIPKALKTLGYEGAKYQLRLFEKGGRELFFFRRNEVHISDSEPEPEEDLHISDPWTDPAPTFSINETLPSFEVRDIYYGAGATPRTSSALEYFAMNLFPIFPFTKYSCFVCVWRQRPGTCPVAIDKVNKGIRLSFFDPLELPKDLEVKPKSTARFAVKRFKGAVTDARIHEQHKLMLRAIKASESYEAASETDYRILVENRPGVFSPKRQNELWIQLIQ